MNDFEPKTPISSPDANAAGVQSQLNWLKAGLIILSVLFSFSIWMQVHFMGLERKSLQPMIKSFEQDKPAVDALLAKVAEYGRTHSAFAPIMQRYNIQPTTGGPGAPATAKPSTPAAAKPAAPPKK